MELSDRLDVSADNERKLSAALLQLGKCREKIEEVGSSNASSSEVPSLPETFPPCLQLQDVKEQLVVEQDARAGHVEK